MRIFAKICLLGDGAVGKTSIAHRYLNKDFSSNYTPTIGADFFSKHINVSIDESFVELHLQIWDLAGQPSFNQVRSRYYRGAVGALLILDLTRPRTLESIYSWSEEFLKKCSSSNPSILILGNKVDLENNIQVTRQSVNDYIKEKLRISDFQFKYFETSAKTGENIDQAFEVMGHSILRRLDD